MDTPRNWLDLLNPKRRNFLKSVGAGAAVQRPAAWSNSAAANSRPRPLPTNPIRATIN